MSDVADELKALREEVAALRKEIVELRATTPSVYIQGVPMTPLPAFPHWPVQPQPMPPYLFQPYFGPNTSDASNIWRYPTSAADSASGGSA